MFPPFKKGGGTTSFTLFWRGGRKKFRTCDFPILLPPLPVINDRSLMNQTHIPTAYQLGEDK